MFHFVLHHFQKPRAALSFILPRKAIGRRVTFVVPPAKFAAIISADRREKTIRGFVADYGNLPYFLLHLRLGDPRHRQGVSKSLAFLMYFSPQLCDEKHTEGRKNESKQGVPSPKNNEKNRDWRIECTRTTSILDMLFSAATVPVKTFSSFVPQQNCNEGTRL